MNIFQFNETLEVLHEIQGEHVDNLRKEFLKYPPQVS